MKHKSRSRVLTVWLLVVLILAGSMPAHAEEPAEESDLGLYFYYLTAKTDGTDGSPIVLELYACTTDASSELLEGASFSLRFPEYLGAMTFTPSAQIMVQRIVPTERYGGVQIIQSGYHAFSWTRYASALGGDSRDDTLNWDTDVLGTAEGAKDARGHILVGTYTFDAKGAVPGAGTVGQQAWPETAESEPVEVDPAYRAQDRTQDPFNQTVWNAEHSAYIGYYMKEKETATLGRIPLKLVFTPPPEWSGIVNVQSYDPKDPLEFLIYPNTTQEGAPTYYRMVVAGDPEGSGLFVRSVRFGKGPFYIEDSNTETQLPDGAYQIVIRKQSHVTATLTGVTVRGTELFPELEGLFVLLPCGDVDASGAVRQDDRALLTARTRYGKPAVAGAPYDLDGDGRVDQRDLAILTAPANYGKKNFTVSCEKQVGENGV